jgi:hypothetical protein
MGGNRRLLGLIVLTCTFAATGAAAPSLADPPTAGLGLFANGPGRIVATMEGTAKEGARTVVCMSNDSSCGATYRVGQLVTLKAVPDRGSSSFEFWSDDRCPQRPECKISVESSGDVVASFSPQLVSVAIFNYSGDPAIVRSTPSGLTCMVPANDSQMCIGEFALFTSVKLAAQGVSPGWGTECDTRAAATCSLTVHSKRDVGVNFSEPPPSGGGVGQIGQPLRSVGLIFRVATLGTGSGTVRSASRDLDCGRRCTTNLGFGSQQTLIARPDRGSRFVRWRGACTTAPKCTLEVGPVTRVTAVFAKADLPVSRPPVSNPSPPAAPLPGPPVSKPPGANPTASNPRPAPLQPQRPQRPFVVQVDRRVVVRGVRPQRVAVTVRVNARSSMRLMLENTRGHVVTSDTRYIRRGRRVLLLSVPEHAKAGKYLLTIEAQDEHGHLKRFKRSVRLRR